jgi:hypothetical protein
VTYKYALSFLKLFLVEVGNTTKQQTNPLLGNMSIIETLKVTSPPPPNLIGYRVVVGKPWREVTTWET